MCTVNLVVPLIFGSKSMIYTLFLLLFRINFHLLLVGHIFVILCSSFFYEGIVESLTLYSLD